MDTDAAAAPRPVDEAGDRAAARRRAVEAAGSFLMPLREHQKQAVTAAWRAVRDGGRAIVESCCGSGKTLIAAACARRVAPHGAVLATMPTIELVWQTVGVWLAHGGRRGPVVIVCSSSENRELEEAGLRVDAVITTKAHRIAEVVRAAAGGPVTVFATYASIDRVVEAHALHGMPGFDLAVVDEAHRTAGSSAKPWAAVHDDTRIPARRRLYFTATPRIAEGLSAGPETGGENVVCSMDDPEVFGETVFRYPVAQGIADGLIADYQVVVPVVTDQDLQELLNEPGISDLRSRRTNEELQRLALQIATCRAIDTYALERVITYHSRIRGAREFVRTLHHAAALLPRSDRLGHLHLAAVAGSDRLKDRRHAFDQFRSESARGGHRCALIANSRLLAEGIDLPAVDAVIFADPKNSIVDIVQGAGRAFRVPLGVTGKVARIIIPVYLPGPADENAEQDDTETELNRSAFAAVWQVLRALAAHDERVTARITELRTNRYGAEQLRPHTAEPGLEQDQDAEEQADGVAAGDADWLRVETTAYQDRILRTLKLRTLSPRTAEWEKWYEQAEAFHQEHGHLDVREGDLVDWLNRQREQHAAGRLDAARISELDRIAMIWNKHAHAWERGYAYARAWHQLHGDLATPAGARIDGYTVGRWLRVQRLGGHLVPEQRQLLDTLDPLWRWDPKWQRGLRRLTAYLAAGGALTGPRNRPGLGDDPGFRPGVWQHQQIQQADELHPDQIALLDGLGPWRTVR
ncbi:Helicase associated domain-containing protein [Streptacidiphilus jiangxiensis]|uniref:Helicase associated domain-containing protein n=1 Tax=Streptacidiphilus jiangxiensis TaxID=235985 RepID=A0A1H7NXQ2_STRJI|nr:Helicase associated domain-containing protein [Streptacidiphilus jiangxiensis]